MNYTEQHATGSNMLTSQKKWIEWRHELVGLIHCGECLSLHKCWFVYGKAPRPPLHDKCHCSAVVIPWQYVKNNVVATSAYSKYDPYLFDPKNFYRHGKNKLFESWGYTIKDAAWLQKEIERQGKIQYFTGNYELGKRNMRGQRINIRITIPRKNGSGEVSFVTGWMVHPEGLITLNTPYGGQ